MCMYIYIYIYIYILFSSFKLLFCFPTDWNIQEFQKHCISQCFFQPSNIKILPRSGLDLQVIFPHMIFSELPSKQIYVLTHPATKPLLALSKEFVYWVLLKLDFVKHAFCKIMTKNMLFWVWVWVWVIVMVMGGVGAITGYGVLKFRKVIEFESSCIANCFSCIYLIIDGKRSLIN